MKEHFERSKTWNFKIKFTKDCIRLCRGHDLHFKDFIEIWNYWMISVKNLYFIFSLPKYHSILCIILNSNIEKQISRTQIITKYVGVRLLWSQLGKTFSEVAYHILIFIHVRFHEIIGGAQKWEREFWKVLTQLCGSNLIRSRTNWSRQKWSREKNEVISSFICSENASLHVAIMHHMKKLFKFSRMLHSNCRSQRQQQ